MANPSVVVEFVADVKKLVAGVKDVQKAGEDASSGLGKVNWRSVAKWGAVAGAAVATGKLLKDSVSSVTDLAKATMGLERATGLDAKTASAWVETLKVRNIETSTFTASLVKLSKLMEKWRTTEALAAKTAADYNTEAARLAPIIAKGGDAGKAATKELNSWGNAADRARTAADKAGAPFTALGVSLEAVKKGDVQKVLLQAADGFAKTTNPATRAALASQLFGRQGQALLPILQKGSAGIQDLLKTAEKYGATISGKTVKDVKKLTDEQHNLQLAQDGVKNSIGQALLPAQVSLYGSLLSLVNVLLPLTKNVEVMKVALIAAAVAMAAYKLAVIQAALAESPLFVALVKSVGAFVAKTAAMIASTVATVAETVAIWALDAGLLVVIGTIGLIVVAIAALVVAGVLLVKHWGDVQAIAGKTWDAVKRGAQAALSWLKSNWPYVAGVLLGPFGIAAAAIYKHWDTITTGARNALNDVRSLFASFVGWFTGIPGEIAAQVTRFVHVFAQLDDPVVAAIGRIRDAVNSLPGIFSRITGALGVVGHALASALKAPINAVLAGWNALKLPGFKIKIPGPLPDISFPGFGLPNIALLAKGGIVTGPTLAMLGEAGAEAVVPLSAGAPPIEVRVFIGETELHGMVRTEVRTAENRTARVLLGGLG